MTRGFKTKATKILMITSGNMLMSKILLRQLKFSKMGKKGTSNSESVL